MKQRRLGKTGWDVSAVSMGCWGIGGQWGEVSERQEVRTVHAALDAVVNLFDTADSYGLGQSEILLGKALAGRRSAGYVATKVGNRARRQDDPPVAEEYLQHHRGLPRLYLASRPVNEQPRRR